MSTWYWLLAPRIRKTWTYVDFAFSMLEPLSLRTADIFVTSPAVLLTRYCTGALPWPPQKAAIRPSAVSTRPGTLWSSRSWYWLSVVVAIRWSALLSEVSMTEPALVT